MTRITFTTVTKRYDSVSPLQNISFTIEPGEFFVLVGPSGCGKSTLLRMIAGLEQITEGTIEFDGSVVNDVEPRNRDVGMVFQNYALYPHLSVRDNLAFPLSVRKVPKQQIYERVSEVAELLKLQDELDKKPKALSGGQRQRVAVGRAIIRKPRLFLFDEPLSNLDAQLRTHMRTELRMLQRTLGVTTVYVTHDQVEAMTMSDRMAILNGGILQQIGTPSEVYNSPSNVFVARFTGSPPMNLIPYNNRTLGVRPEHINMHASSDAIALSVTVTNVEYIGHEWLEHATFGNHDVVRRSSTAPVYQHSNVGNASNTADYTFPIETTWYAPAEAIAWF